MSVSAAAAALFSVKLDKPTKASGAISLSVAPAVEAAVIAKPYITSSNRLTKLKFSVDAADSSKSPVQASAMSEILKPKQIEKQRLRPMAAKLFMGTSAKDDNPDQYCLTEPSMKLRKTCGNFNCSTECGNTESLSVLCASGSNCALGCADSRDTNINIAGDTTDDSDAKTESSDDGVRDAFEGFLADRQASTNSSITKNSTIKMESNAKAAASKTTYKQSGNAAALKSYAYGKLYYAFYIFILYS